MYRVTIAINAILERKGAKTALLITEGFRDIYEIGRINRPDAYNLFFRKHEPLVERALRFEVKERVLSDGEIEVPLDEKEIEAFGRTLERLGVEAIAILLLNCFARHDHEARAKAILERNHPRMFVSASHELSEEYREFERCSTVVANAYIGPIVRRYLGEIEGHIRSDGFSGSFLIVQSTGGLYQAEQAKSHCVHMLESGPSAGVIGVVRFCWKRYAATTPPLTTQRQQHRLPAEMIGSADSTPMTSPMPASRAPWPGNSRRTNRMLDPFADSSSSCAAFPNATYSFDRSTCPSARIRLTM